MIKTVIFDIGNVLMKFDWMGYLYKTFEKTQAERVNQAIMGTGFWDELDVALRKEEEIFQSMVDAAPELEAEIRAALAHDSHAMEKHSYAIPWIQELKQKGYQVLFLSNYSKHVMKSKWEVLDFLPYMDGGIFSCEVHLVKPEASIFQLLMKQYDLQAEECLFIDDREENVAAAKKMGMQGFVFKGYEESYAQIMERLS